MTAAQVLADGIGEFMPVSGESGTTNLDRALRLLTALTAAGYAVIRSSDKPVSNADGAKGADNTETHRQGLIGDWPWFP